MPRKKKPSKDQALLTCLQHSLRQRLLVIYVEAKEKRSPRELADVTVRLAGALGVDLADLFSGVGGWYVRPLPAPEYGLWKIIRRPKQSGMPC